MKAALVALITAFIAGSACAETAPTETQQRLACMGDALRLCAEFVPDREQIRRCLAAQHASLSPGCRPVFDASMKAMGAASPDKP